MLDIGNTDVCTGCSACYSICPTRAIEMQSDEEGFLRPCITFDKCIKCFRCESVCPVLEKSNVNMFQVEAFACYVNDSEIRRNSSSGGIFPILAKYVINKGGVVFGACFDNDFNVIHDFSENIEGCTNFYGSKYVQSQIKDSFIRCKQFLSEGRLVLFSGTPCQIGGLLSYLEKPYDNLVCVDFICHGVPTPLLWKKYLKQISNGNVITKITFRSKEFGWKLFSLKIDYYNSKYYEKTFTKDRYMQFFLADVCLRNSCYECNFKGLNRVSDITLADFWGIENVLPDYFDDLGTSLVIVNSEKGSHLFNKTLDELMLTSVDITKATKHNSPYFNSVRKPLLRFIFLRNLKYSNFDIMYVLLYISKILLFLIALPKRLCNKISSFSSQTRKK